MRILSELISSFDARNPNFRPTEIYNESWLVKLVMLQASTISNCDFPTGFLAGSTWFSEALLPTVFKARYQGDKLSEFVQMLMVSLVIFSLVKRKVDFELKPNSNQFARVEAKIGSPLSKGTSNASYFDQAARSVACMAEVIAQAEISPSSFSRLDFIVLAPEASIVTSFFQSKWKAILQYVRK